MDPRAPRVRTFPGEKGPAPARAPRTAPALDLEVVEWLERAAPEVTPDRDMDAGALWHAHGRRSLALYARAEYNRQQEPD